LAVRKSGAQAEEKACFFERREKARKFGSANRWAAMLLVPVLGQLRSYGLAITALVPGLESGAVLFCVPATHAQRNFSALLSVEPAEKETIAVSGVRRFGRDEIIGLAAYACVPA
jgi:hypothetical protein